MRLSRRACLAGLAGLGLASRGRLLHGDEPAPESLPAVRAITRGPKFHWFGYYDKFQFDATGRHALANQITFEHRLPTADDEIRLGAIDLEDDDRWTEIGASRTWCWQQGCMLQWRPAHDSEILWNDRQGDRFVCRLLDVKSGNQRIVPWAIDSVSPDGRFALAADFSRLFDMRPECGYAGLADPHADELAPQSSGVWRIDLGSGEARLLFSLADLLDIPHAGGYSPGAKHFINHTLISPDGSRFVFLHRWRGEREGRGFATRMFTASTDGGDLHVVDPSGHTSHFAWRDSAHILAWTRPRDRDSGFYLFIDKTEQCEQVGAGRLTENGHVTYLPQGDWLLNDTYPDRERLQHPHLFHIPSGRRVPLGHFLSPKPYTGVMRCDTHPRSDRAGRRVAIDSPHGGAGRQVYLIELGDLTA